MTISAWKQLLKDEPWFHKEDSFPIVAYSEFMPPPRLGVKPYGDFERPIYDPTDPWGWAITEYEEALEIRPGFEHLAQQILSALIHLGSGQSAHGIAKNKLLENPYWPPQLSKYEGSLHHERYVVLMPLALSRTQDDKGRVRWTLFGSSEQGPARPFWQGFYTAPGREVSEEQGLDFFRELLDTVYHERKEKGADLKRAGFYIFPGNERLPSFGKRVSYPTWARRLFWKPRQRVDQVKYLLTFEPFGDLPDAVQQAYLKGKLHLLPFPGSLFFWGAQPYLRLQAELPLALQIPLLHMIARHEAPTGIRVPQSGWMHEPRAGGPNPSHHGPVRNTYKRTHRWARVHRDEDELALETREEKLLHVLFSSAPDDVGLYGKPMARNVQLWTHDYHLLLNGPSASASSIKNAEHAVLAGGLFGYRLFFPPMQIGPSEVFWHRPLVAFRSAETGLPTVFHGAPTGFLTAYDSEHVRPDRAIELWPRRMDREDHTAGLRLFQHAHDPRPHQTVSNVRKILQTWELLGEQPLCRTFARQLLTLPKHGSFDEWVDSLSTKTADAEGAHRLADHLRSCVETTPPKADEKANSTDESLTLAHTGKRSFEVTYWKTIARLAEGKYLNKDNADCVNDAVTQSLLPHDRRDLEALGDYLISYYRRVVRAAHLGKNALVGDLPFTWRTDFDFSWSGGWLRNQEGETNERDIMVVIPGRDRRRAVIMADHYDTAYMENYYEPARGGKGARVAAAGADDNHSATAALMLGAPIFLDLSRRGKLDCDIWLIHLTGEEFPSDCMGARYLCQRLVERRLKMRLATGGHRDLSNVRVQGLYVLDMVAHNNDHDRDIFQIAPGTSRQSMWLAYQAHLANEAWNTATHKWNRRASRRNLGRGRRSPDGTIIPSPAKHLPVSGEIRTTYGPRSTLYNTDGQIFSDAGVPVVLFMENYDINRTGYHDSYDTMANIDLDYGSAVAAIAIESVARAASQRPGIDTFENGARTKKRSGR